MSLQPRRIRLKPWLIAQVNSCKYPGLQWRDPEKTQFQIPWHHATRHLPLIEEENTIFKAWAVETGKYHEGVDDPDPAKWKANLRCALNKSREFRLIHDGTKETPVQPFKVYEVCDHLLAGDTGDDDDELPHIVDLSLDTGITNQPSYPVGNPLKSSAPFISSPMCDTYIPTNRTDQMPPHTHLNGGAPLAPVPHAPAVTEFPCHVPIPYSHMAHTDMTTQVAPAVVEDHSMSEVQHQEVEQVQLCINDLLTTPQLLPLTDLDIKFQYRGRTVGALTVSNLQGCRLYYSNLEATTEQVDLFGPVTLHQVLFPGTAEIPNEKQRFYTEHLLNVMDRGLILEMKGEDIYACRLCQCKVFWSGPGVPEPGPPNPMEREKNIRVFSLNTFLHGLILYAKGETSAPPPYEIYFCFGEDWPDKKPKEKKLIVVQVIPVAARMLAEIASSRELSFSTDSVRLQISYPDLKDQTVEQFKELHRLAKNQWFH